MDTQGTQAGMAVGTAEKTKAQKAEKVKAPIIKRRRRHFYGRKPQGMTPLEALFSVVASSRKGPGGTITIPAQVYSKVQEVLRAAVA